jgi:hypothetical protein
MRIAARSTLIEGAAAEIFFDMTATKTPA